MKNIHELRGWTTPDEAGCWIWKGGYTQNGYLPVAHMPKGSKEGGGKMTLAAYRAAWLFAGNKIPDGHVVYRHVCLNHKCVNPHHCKTGTKAEMHKRYSDSGKNKGQPNRILANQKNRKKMLLSPERVAQIQALLDEGVGVKEIMARLKTDGGTVRKVRAGVHPVQLGSLPVAHSSIFSFARSEIAAKLSESMLEAA